MKSLFLFLLLCAAAFSVFAQRDSLRLHGDGEVKLNPEALRELEMNFLRGMPEATKKKAWMEFDNSLPSLPQAPEEKVKLTLRPYTANTRYDWDPVYQKKIRVGRDTWRGDRLYELRKEFGGRRQTWRAENLLAGVKKSLANNYGKVSLPKGYDFMQPFTREFWNFKGRKRRARTLEALRAYGDSLQVRFCILMDSASLN